MTQLTGAGVCVSQRLLAVRVPAVVAVGLSRVRRLILLHAQLMVRRRTRQREAEEDTWRQPPHNPPPKQQQQQQ